MLKKSHKLSGIGPKIAIIPILAILALLLVKGVDWHLSSTINSATDSGEKGSAIALKLTESLFFETDYLFNPRNEILTRIQAENRSINDLVTTSLAEKPGGKITRSLEKIRSVMAQHQDIFLQAVEIVRAISRTRNDLDVHFRENDALLKEITDSIATLATRLIMKGEYLHEAKREFRNSLRELMGFSASQMLNINDLLSFSNEKKFIEAEEALDKKMLLVSTTCENLSLASGDPADHQNWRKIQKKQELIKHLGKELHGFWRVREALAKKLEVTNQEVQKSALNIVNEAGQQIEAVRKYHRIVDIFTITLTILLLALLSTLVIRSLTRPLIQTTRVMKEFSKGSVKGLSIGTRGRRDEIGELQESFDRMIDNNREIVAMARSLADGNYDVTIKPRSDDDELSLSLITMTTALRDFSSELEGRSEQLEKLVIERTQELKKTIEALEKNIADRKQTEEKLREREERLRAIFEAAENVSFIITDATDPVPSVLEFSPGAEKIFGYRKSEMIGNPVSVLHLPEDVARFPEAHRAMRNGKGLGFSGETTLIRKSGEAFPAFFSTYPLLDDNNEMVAALGVSIDISLQKGLEDKLRQAQKMESIGTLAGGIAHDFNNILSIILGNAELAFDDTPEWSPAHASLKEIKTASLRATDVVRQLLSFSRKTELDRRPIRVDPIVKETVKLLRASIPSSIEIRWDIESDMGAIKADPTQIHQVLINLCMNGAHAMEESGGTLEVSLAKVDSGEAEVVSGQKMSSGPHVRLTVKDSGHGMEKHVADRIFDPYFTTKEVGKGTGMGLAVVHGIVRGHNGTISVKSEPGKGTTFQVFFPMIQTEPAPAPEREGKLPTGEERILYVDDEASMVELNRERLKRMGYTVMGVTDPQEALDLFRADPESFDLIITDMTMPHMTGDKLAREILKIRPDTPIILCTGYSDKISDENVQEFGIRKYIEKPIEMKKLARTVREVLDGQGG